MMGIQGDLAMSPDAIDGAMSSEARLTHCPARKRFALFGVISPGFLKLSEPDIPLLVRRDIAPHSKEHHIGNSLSAANERKYR